MDDGALVGIAGRHQVRKRRAAAERDAPGRPTCPGCIPISRLTWHYGCFATLLSCPWCIAPMRAA